MTIPRQVDGFPRRNRLDHNTEAEMAIRKAIQEVEAVGADPVLTEIVTGLNALHGKLADYVDAKMNKLDEMVGLVGVAIVEDIRVKMKVVSVDHSRQCGRCGGAWGVVEVVETIMLSADRVLLAGTQAMTCLNDIKFEETVTTSDASSTTAG